MTAFIIYLLIGFIIGCIDVRWGKRDPIRSIYAIVIWPYFTLEIFFKMIKGE
jgi:hypothetical protein